MHTYVSLVKSQLPYATEVWSPTSANLRTILERVQRGATPWIPRTGIDEMFYKEPLLTLRLLTYGGCAPSTSGSKNVAGLLIIAFFFEANKIYAKQHLLFKITQLFSYPTFKK